MRKAAVTLALGLTLAACSSSSSHASDQDNVTETPGSEASPASDPKAACAEAGPDLVTRIEGLAPAGSGLKVQETGAIKSPDFNNVYFVAVKFSATGVSDQTGVWAVNGSLDGSGTLLAIDAMAQQFYDGPDGDKTAADISKTDRGVDTAKQCL